MARDLSRAKCVLLAVHYASESNIKALQSLTIARSDVLNPELVLRIVLTYLPESIEPKEYAALIRNLCFKSTEQARAEDRAVDTTPVKELTEQKARKRVKRLQLLDLRRLNYPEDASEDTLTQFLLHRAYRIDDETGLLNLIPQLIEPFLEHSSYLRSWYIGNVLPLLRMQFEYYPQEQDHESLSLVSFERLSAEAAVERLMRYATWQDPKQGREVARDVRGLVGPWMYSANARKRRKLDHAGGEKEPAEAARTMENESGSDWVHMYRWMIDQTSKDFGLVTEAIEGWDGPGDADLGGFHTSAQDEYLDEAEQSKLERLYAQAAMAVCYTTESPRLTTLQYAHRILVRLSRLLDYDPPPDLESGPDNLPTCHSDLASLVSSLSERDLDPSALLTPNHPLTTPSPQSYNLLTMITFSAYQNNYLRLPAAPIDGLKLWMFNDADEQLSIPRNILRGFGGYKRDDAIWEEDRGRLLWLRSWGAEDVGGEGRGKLGKIPREQLEEEILGALVETGSYELAIEWYLKSDVELISRSTIERVVLAKAMDAYDSASNGNRTRGGVKKANDIINAFRPYFPESTSLRQATALISATHALSFYSLTLQHGVPFQPVSIRVSQDPVGLVNKILEQNPESYTQLDDLIGIAQNLVSAGLPQQESSAELSGDSEDLEAKRKKAEKRVTFMAIEAALHEDDFETAYSYIVSRLTPSGADIEAPNNSKHKRNISTNSVSPNDDDTSWRAAFLAGRYRPSTSSPPQLRRLEQRTELLSLALLLAPTSALAEILAAWRRCEEETTALQKSQQQVEEEIDDRADKRQSLNSALPGGFSIEGEQPDLVLGQKRREMGRMTGGGDGKRTAGGEEAPVSMFDLTRSAAQALSKNAFPLRSSARSAASRDSSRPVSGSFEGGGMESSVDSLGGEIGGREGLESQAKRTRRRDQVASAVSGGLASGLGWVLGATPVARGSTDGGE